MLERYRGMNPDLVYQDMSGTIASIMELGVKRMPVLARLATIRTFVAAKIKTIPDESDHKKFTEWKREYALGVMKAFPEINEVLSKLPEGMRGDMAVMILEKQIMPATQAEIKRNIPL